MFSSSKLQSTPSGITPPTAYTAEERVAYVRYLDVDVASTADAGYSAAVNGCGAVVYLTGVTAQMKEDVIYSTLLAQLDSDKKYPGRPVDKAQEWFDNYCSVLQGVGWVVDNFRLRDISNANKYGSVDRLVLELAGSFLTEAGLGPFKGMLNGLRDAVQNSVALKIFNERASHGNSAGFQLWSFVRSSFGGVRAVAKKVPNTISCKE
ncbi:hypothetical protein GY45DRAFT_1371687 [Cubamyces sp. BRFM 1775]|nr:hypothetical protein GY45DRAFT_1371687 [Cubamyces sp. BRFM 1775]